MHPALSCDLEGLGSVVRSCAYRASSGAIAVADAAGRLTYSDYAGGPDRPMRGAHDLLALGLSAPDVAAIVDSWEDRTGSRSLAEHRLRRAALAGRLGAPRARELAEVLRSARRGVPPPGSVALAWYYRRFCIPDGLSDADALREGRALAGPAPLLRFPNGKGYWIDGSPACGGWYWPSGERLPCVVVLAAGLSELQVEAASRCSGYGRTDADHRAAAEAHLRAGGLL